MQKLVLFMMVSADGCFEGPGHDLSWHNVDAEFNAFADKQLAEFGSLLFGHRTYDLMASFWTTKQGKEGAPGTAKLMNEMPKFVAAHVPFEAHWAGTTVIADGDAVKRIAQLKEESGKGILLLGSNMLCVSLMEAGLVDEFRLMANPVALGGGTALFSGLAKRMKFSRLSLREFTSGNVLISYVPSRS